MEALEHVYLTDILLGFTLSMMVFAIFFLIVYCIYLKSKHRQYSHLKGPPRTSLFFGNAGELENAKRKGVIIADVLLRWVETYGHTFHFFVFHQPVVFTANAELVKELLVVKDLPKSEMMTNKLIFVNGVRFLGRGMSTETDSSTVHRRRNALGHFFNKNGARDHMKATSALHEVAEETFTVLSKAAKNEETVDITNIIHRASLDAIAKVCFNMDVDSIKDPSVALMDALNYVTSKADVIMATHLFRFKNILRSIYPFKLGEDKRLSEAIALMRETACFCLNIREKHVNDKLQDVLTQFISLRNNKRKSSPPSVYIDDFVNILISGKDSTANTAVFAFLEVLRHPEILQKLRDEIKHLNRKQVLCVDTLYKLEYLQCIIKETQRLYPAKSCIHRFTPSEIQQKKLRIPAGTEIMFSSYVASRMSKSSAHSSEFKPERFLNSSKLRPAANTYYPYSLGSRNCLGQSLSTLIISMILVRLFQNFNFTIKKENSVDIIEQYTLQTKNNVMCKLENRHKSQKKSTELSNDSDLNTEIEP